MESSRVTLQYSGVFLILLLPLLSLGASAKLTREELRRRVDSLHIQETRVREQIALEQVNLESLRRRHDELAGAISTATSDRFTILRISSSDTASVRMEIEALGQEVGVLESLSSDQLHAEEQKLAGIRRRIDDILSRPVSWLWSVRTPAWAVRDRVIRLEEAAVSYVPPSPAPLAHVQTPDRDTPVNRSLFRHANTYQVGAKGESLYTIASAVYGNPNSWPRIYYANRSVIDSCYHSYREKEANPRIAEPEDLLVRGVRLTIPR